MTIEKRLTEELISRGMWPEEAGRLVETMKADSANENCPLHTMEHRWSDDVADYPKEVLALLWVELQRRALTWIDENCPKAWYRSVVAE